MSVKTAQPWFVFAGGGTGGHLYPGLAVARVLRDQIPDCRISFFTTTKDIDGQIIQPFGCEIAPQPVRPWNSKPTTWWAFAKAYFASKKQAKAAFSQHRPAVVLGLGGYAAAPAIEAARKLKIPTAVFNPDAVPGRANRRLIGRVNAVFVQWETTVDLLGRPDHVMVTGCPVRPEFLEVTRDEGCKACGLDPARKVLVITGASQGATSINAAALAMIDFFARHAEWQIFHITGAGDLDGVKREYARKLPQVKVIDFTPRIAWALAAADLVLSRAGASTLAELTALGRASVLMPYPHDKAKHQRANARVLADADAAVIVDDRIDAAANAKVLQPILEDLMKLHERRRRMAQAARAISRDNAADMIAARLMDMAAP